MPTPSFPLAFPCRFFYILVYVCICSQKGVAMTFEDIFEPIEVISHFRDGQLKPLRFKWNGRVYKIKQLNGHWVSHQGYNKQHHYSVISDSSDYFELQFDSSDFQWQVARVCLDG